MTASAGPPTTTTMTDELGPGTATRPWYRRRGFLVTVGVVVIVAAAVLSDLPTPTTRASDIQGESAVIGEINADVAPCLFSVREALTLYGDESGRLSPAHRAQIPALLRDDQNACSYTDSAIFDLSDISPIGSPAGRKVSQALNTSTTWATSDALGAITAIQSLTADPGDRKARTTLQADEKLLALDRDKATGEIDDAGRLLKTTLPPLSLSLEVLPGVAHR